MKAQGTGASGAVPVSGAGLAYKVGLGVTITGVAIFASSWLLGGVVFAALMAVLGLLGAPENRMFLPPEEPEAGMQLLQLFGGILFLCGSCIVSFRLVVELLGLTANSELTSRLEGAEKLGSGAAAIGVLVVASTGLPQVILYELFLYDYGSGAAMSALQSAVSVGVVALFGGLAVLILGRPNRRRALLGWTDRVGWGRLGSGWINKLGLGLIALALAGGILGFQNPTAIISAAGIGILIVGIVPHILAGGRP